MQDVDSDWDWDGPTEAFLALFWSRPKINVTKISLIYAHLIMSFFWAKIDQEISKKELFLEDYRKQNMGFSDI